ncbi:MAG: virulence RhuM family protein [Bacteroidales bacterium]|nr:virulence RhuM family protein [Bacteroidales bacterium]
MKPNNSNTLSTSSQKGEIVLYQTDENIRIEVRLEDETVWLTQAQMAELFDVKEHTITYHIKEIYRSNELNIVSTARKIRVVRKEGNRTVNRQLDFYNLDMILSVGYRVNSVRGIMFRRWSSEVLKQFMLRGYSVNQHLISLQEHIDNRLYNIESRVDDHEQKIDFLIQKEQPVTEQLFSTGCVWDAYTFVSNLVRSASKRVVLIDSFVDERTLMILDKRTDGVDCTIHTRFNSKLQLDLQKHNQQCNHIIIVQLPQAVHDRYLIIDDEVWLLGASVKDMGRGLCTIIKLGFSPEEILKRI